MSGGREVPASALGRLLGAGYEPRHAASWAQKRAVVRCVEEWVELERPGAHRRVRSLRLAVARGQPPDPDELALHINWLLAHRLREVRRKVQLNATICGFAFNAFIFSFYFKKHFLWVKNTFFIGSTVLIQGWAAVNTTARCYDALLGVYLFNKMGHLAQVAADQLLLQKAAPDLAYV